MRYGVLLDIGEKEEAYSVRHALVQLFECVCQTTSPDEATSIDWILGKYDLADLSDEEKNSLIIEALKEVITVVEMDYAEASGDA